MLHREERISGETPFSGRIFRADRDVVRLANGSESIREVARHNTGGACVLCELNGKVALVSQFRYAYGCELLEVPAGKLEPGETPAQAAARELTEETGLIADKLVDLGECCPSPGWMVEHLHIFAAEGVRPGQAHLDEDEFLDVVWMDADEAYRMVLANELPDAKTQIALLKWRALKERRVQNG